MGMKGMKNAMANSSQGLIRSLSTLPKACSLHYIIPSATLELSPILTTGVLDSERHSKTQIVWRDGYGSWTERPGLKWGPHYLGTRAPLLK